MRRLIEESVRSFGKAQVSLVLEPRQSLRQRRHLGEQRAVFNLGSPRSRQTLGRRRLGLKAARVAALRHEIYHGFPGAPVIGP